MDKVNLYNFERMNQALFKQAIAALLSISFLWIFAACILLCNDSVCLDESSNAGGEIVNHSETPSDACPIVASAKATTTERIAVDSFTFTIVTWRQIFNFKPQVNLVKIQLSPKVSALSNPPLKRLFVLRI
jgi:hypothetical protein